jgi:hypothetical protein
MLSIVILNLIIKRKVLVIEMDGYQLSFVFHLECTVAVIALAFIICNPYSHLQSNVAVIVLAVLLSVAIFILI